MQIYFTTTNLTFQLESIFHFSGSFTIYLFPCFLTTPGHNKTPVTRQPLVSQSFSSFILLRSSCDSVLDGIFSLYNKNGGLPF